MFGVNDMRKQNQLGQWQPTKAARRASLLLFILSAAFITAGTYGWLMGDWNLESLRPIAAEVYEARRVARSFEQPITGTVDLFGEGRGTVPIALLSLIMNNAIVIIILGITFLVNAIMLRIQSWERMKDFMCVQPALIFFLLFVYYPVIDLVRISFTDMRMLVPDPQEFIGFKNYEWLFLKSGWNRFSESLLITARYTFWELFITLVGGLLLAPAL
jgi:hypothetical protein